MTILLPTLAVAFAAFCVWLTVRIVNRRERWAKWTLASTVIAPTVLYIACFGYACRVSSRTALWEPGSREARIPAFYWPIPTLSTYCPGGQSAVVWYLN